MYSSHFMQAPTREESPDYYNKIKEPIDFQTVKQRVDSNSYASESDLVTDCNKVLQNAVNYYADSSPLHKDALKLQAYLNGRFQIFLNRQNLSLAELDDLSTSAITHSSVSNTALPKFADLKEKLVFLYKYIEDYK